MSHNRPPLPVIIIVVLAIIASAVYFFYPQAIGVAATSTSLSASGTVETTQIRIAPEIAGKIVAVNVDEGDSVKQGDVLFTLDGTLLNAQKQAALAALDTAKSAVLTADAAVATAQAQVDLALINALNEEQAKRLDDWNNSAPADFDQPAWYFDKTNQLMGIEAELASAQTALDAAIENVKFYEDKATSGDFLNIEKRLLEARAAYQITESVLNSTSGSSQDLRDAAQTRFDDAKSELDDAQKAYDDAMTTDGSADILQARAEYRVAKERYDLAADRLRAIQTGELSPKVVAAQKALDQAKAAAEQASQAVKQAEANIALLDAQLSKLTITAPEDGQVIDRNLEPGEVANPGSIVLTLARAGDLTITVYIPEDRYGEISLGQPADVSVDSFAGQTFSATVINISDKAEFTPRNVQTAEGRKTTVFAIKLRVDDPEAKLKAGMPADVVFK
jgi:HlyD family secretion protein